MEGVFIWKKKYRSLFKVNYFRAKYKGPRASMRCGPLGFWLVDSSKMLRATKDPYILANTLPTSLLKKSEYNMVDNSSCKPAWEKDI